MVGIGENKVEHLGHYFTAEQNGAFKSDLCRLAALYLHGGYYFDADMEVVNPVTGESLEQKIKLDSLRSQRYDNHINFITARSVYGGHFFQSFLACVPFHPLIDLSLRLTVHYYEGKLDSWITRDDVVGPQILFRAYKLTTFVDPDDDEPTGDSIIMKKLLSPEIIPRTDESLIYRGAYILQEDHPRDLPSSFPKREIISSPGYDCNLVLRDLFYDKHPVAIDYEHFHFYSRIEGSTNCYPDRHSFCGEGKIGNGMCAETRRDGSCCSLHGWCGTSDQHCLNVAVAGEGGGPPMSFMGSGKEPMCGEGVRGNGKCPQQGDCCSRYGWCGSSEEHCEGTSGSETGDDDGISWWKYLFW